MKMIRVLSFGLLLALFLANTLQTSTNVDQEDVVEPNHFYSASNLSKLYNIGSLKQYKALSIVLKETESQKGQKYDNSVTMTLNIGSSKK